MNQYYSLNSNNEIFTIADTTVKLEVLYKQNNFTIKKIENINTINITNIQIKSKKSIEYLIILK